MPRLMQIKVVAGASCIFGAWRRMRVPRWLPLVSALIVGFSLGGLAASAVHSQSNPPAYFVTLFDSASRSEIADTNYPSLAPATFQPFGGRYLIHGGRTISFDGQPPKQIVVIAFENMDRLQQWHQSPAFKQAYDVQRIAQVKAFAVEGVGSNSAGGLDGSIATSAGKRAR